MNAAEFLTSLFEEATRKIVDIEYKEEFRGSTGYFEPMMSMALGLPMGTRFRFNTGPGNNRRVVGIVTPVGNVIFFDRFTGGENEVVVQNVPAPLSGLYPSGAVTFESIHQAMGGKDGYGVSVAEVVSRICNIANMLPIHAKVGWLVNREIVIGDEIPTGDFEGDHVNVVKAILDAPMPASVKDVIRDKGSDNGIDRGFALASRARMEMTQIHADAKIEDPSSVSMTEIMDRIETFLRDADFKSDVDPARIEELANMLPETGYRYRAARIALIAAMRSNIDMTDLMVALRTCTPEEVNKWVVGAIDNQLTGGRATTPSSNRS